MSKNEKPLDERCPFCGGKMKIENWPWLDGTPCWQYAHADWKRAVKKKCPMEMGGYPSAKLAMKAWRRRR